MIHWLLITSKARRSNYNALKVLMQCKAILQRDGMRDADKLWRLACAIALRGGKSVTDALLPSEEWLAGIIMHELKQYGQERWGSGRASQYSRDHESPWACIRFTAVRRTSRTRGQVRVMASATVVAMTLVMECARSSSRTRIAAPSPGCTESVCTSPPVSTPRR